MGEGRTAGPVGRVLRFLAGTALTVHAAQHMIVANTLLNLQAMGVVLGLLALYSVIHLAIARFVPSINAWLGAVLALSPAVLIFVLIDPSLRFALVLFIGVSLLVTAIRADGGCEVMTLPGVMMGKRTHLVCIVFSPLDWVEEKLTRALSSAKNDSLPGGEAQGSDRGRPPGPVTARAAGVPVKD